MLETQGGSFFYEGKPFRTFTESTFFFFFWAFLEGGSSSYSTQFFGCIAHAKNQALQWGGGGMNIYIYIYVHIYIYITDMKHVTFMNL